MPTYQVILFTEPSLPYERSPKPLGMIECKEKELQKISTIKWIFSKFCLEGFPQQEEFLQQTPRLRILWETGRIEKIEISETSEDETNFSLEFKYISPEKEELQLFTTLTFRKIFVETKEFSLPEKISKKNLKVSPEIYLTHSYQLVRELAKNLIQ